MRSPRSTSVEKREVCEVKENPGACGLGEAERRLFQGESSQPCEMPLRGQVRGGPRIGHWLEEDIGRHW